MKVLDHTQSVCPVCLRVIDAEIFEDGGKVWIRKTCPEHGEFSDLYWGDYEMYERAKKWAHDGRGVENPQIKKDNAVCPRDCGLCPLHKSHTALANIVVTNRCNLNCWYCFFYAEKAGYVYEPTIEQYKSMINMLVNEKPVKCNAIQLTGGEPTLRDDLVDLIRIAKETGIDHVQLNTNGIILSKDLELAKKVKEAGVNTLYLSFDGVTPQTNPKNHWEIPGVLENCRKANIGIVLVPTVIKSVNDHEVGDILRFGFENMDVVRGVNYQPVSLVGQMPKKEIEKYRISIPDVIKRIEDQTNGEVSKNDWYPIPVVAPITKFIEAMTGKPQYDLSAHFACGSATYIFEDEGKMVPITRFVDVDGLLKYLDEKAEEVKNGRNRLLVAMSVLKNIGKFIDKEKQPKNLKLSSILYNALVKHNYKALGVFHHKSLFVGMMHFMDNYNYDIERVKRCVIHYATPDGKVIPFCTFNVMPEWYRDKIQKEYSISSEEWEKKTGRKLKDELYIRNVKELESTELYKKTYKNFLK